MQQLLKFQLKWNIFPGVIAKKTKNKGISADSRQKTKETVKITIEISL